MKRKRKMVRNSFQKAGTYFRNLISKWNGNRGATPYAKQGSELLNQGKNKEARFLFQKGLKFYPYHFKLNKELALLAMEEKDWSQAISHWTINTHFNEKRMSTGNYLDFAKSLQLNGEEKKQLDVLSKAIIKFPKNKEMIIELASMLSNQEEWKKSIDVWNKYFVMETRKPIINAFKQLSKAYRKLNFYNDAEMTLRKSIETYPDNKVLLEAYLNIAIIKKDWFSALRRVENIFEIYGNNLAMNYWVTMSMLNQIIGNNQKANEIFQYMLTEYHDKVREDDKGYRKITLFDNGESRIEFYKKLEANNKVIVTFDSINMEWQSPSFAFNLLRKQNLDIIAVRKKEKNTFQQDLSQDEFLKSVSPLIGGYKDKISYGFSLGAYSALYFSSLIDCRILALSPRLSIHPVYGRTKIMSKYEMKHNLFHPYNDKISPIIVYDPKNALDSKYINKEILRSFPNARLVKIPYAGHGIGPHLSKTGLLKHFIITVINGTDIPEYDRIKKSKSPIYLRNLGEECLRHNKPKWALELVNRMLKLSPNDTVGINLKIDILNQLGQYDHAIKRANNSVKK